MSEILIKKKQKYIAAALIFVLQAFFSLLFSGWIATAKEIERKTVSGDTARFEMQEVVVTATGIDEPIQNIAKNVTVITAEDIEQATSNNVTDLIEKESGINLQSFFGNDKRAALDIRGMGITAVSNVVVMVDGFRLNALDLAGPDLSSVPLDQIEKIEIVRGGSSVLYGDGAVGGVINIITKKGQKEPETRLHLSAGSYNTFDGRLSHRSAVKKLTFSLNGSYYDSDGYRENGFLRKKDAGLDLGYKLSKNINLTLAGAFHEDDYGLPGPVSKEDIGSREKRKLTDRPDDSGETKDRRASGGIEIDGGKWGVISARRGYRYRDNDYILGYTPLLPPEEQINQIEEDTKTLDVGYVKAYTFFGREHSFRCGLNRFETLYVSTRVNLDDRKNSDTDNYGLFFMNDWLLATNLSFSLGYRYNVFQGTFRTDERQKFGSVKRWVNGAPYEREWENDAVEAGIVYSLSTDTTLFASASTSFRIPNVDELADSDDDLHPQEGNHFDLGVRHRFSGMFEISATFFRTSIRDEIFYSEVPGTGIPVNRNLDDRTIRQGIETDIKAYPTDSLYLWGNLTVMKAEFADTGATIPLVPEVKSTVGLEWRIIEPLVLSVSGTFVGPRYDGLDVTNNRFERLGAYEVFDSKLTYTRDDFSLFAGINNMFDELYSTIAFGETYYPMPERNFFAGVKYVF